MMERMAWKHGEEWPWVEVMDIKYDKVGYPHFLFYYEGQWLIRSAKEFIPYSDAIEYYDKVALDF